MTTHAVQLTSVSRRYGAEGTGVTALDDVTLAFPRGSFTAVTGPSGSGKSTLLQCAAGLDRPTSGSVRIGGTELTGLGERRLTLLRRARIGFVFQSYNLLPALTAEQNVALPLRLAGRRPSRARVRAALAQVGLADRADHHPARLSGGQQQRVAVARALITRPEVLFGDEPTGALDSTTAREVLTLLRALVDDEGQTVVMVTHDPVAAAAAADRVVFLVDGRVHDELAAADAETVAARMASLESRTAAGGGGVLTTALRTLYARRTSFAGSFVALALGVALLTVMGQALAASLHAPDRSPERFAAAPVVVRADDTLQVPTPAGPRTARLPHAPPLRPATLAALAALGRVTPDRSFPVRLPGGPDGLVGHPWSTARFAPYALTAGRAPAAPDEVVTAGGRTRPGARLRTSHGTVTVVGTVRAVGPERPVFYTDARAAALAPEVRQAVVEADATAVRAALRGDARVRVLTGAARRLADADPDRDAEALTALNALFGTAGGVSGFVSVFVVSSTFAFAVAQRRREFALLRTAGATPGQLRRAVLVEALLVGALASAAGCALGAYAAPHLAALVVDGGLAPAWYRVGGAVWPYHVAFWTGLSVALAGASSAAWRAGRTPAVDALREVSVDPARLPRARWVCGAVLLLTAAATLAYTLLTDPGDLLHRKTWVSRPLLLISGVAVLSPALVRPLARLLVRLPGVLGLLVRQNVLTGARRTASLAAPVLVTVALAGSLLGATATLGGARAAEVDRQTAADFVVTPADGTTFAPAALARLRRVPGAEVSATATTAVQTLEDGVALVAFPARAAEPGPLARTVRLPVTAGHLADLDDDAIVVTREWARHRVGERVRIWRGDGTPRTLRVVAVLATGTGGTGAYVTPANAPGAGVDRVDVRVRAGASAAAVARHLRAVEGVRLRTKAQWVRASWPAPNRTTRLGVLLVLGIALLYTGLSVANTALMATAARRTELTTLRLTGLTRAQILRLTALETLTAVALGAALGVLVTLTGLSGLTAALHLLGSPPTLTVPWRPIAWTTTACALLSLTATSTATARSLSGAGVGGGN